MNTTIVFRLAGFNVLTPKVEFSGNLKFGFSIINNQDREQLVRLEYALYYLKANGSLSKKVFKISERIYKPYERFNCERKQSFRVITTRKFYPGMHKVAVILTRQ